MIYALEFTALFLWCKRSIYLYSEYNNTWMLGNVKCISRVERAGYRHFAYTRIHIRIHIYAHICIILYSP